ncbi:major facilitator superfamily transporter [Talaromyces proteolyticus]|uniref:Major facilitator superfamily transporter n=1 Tax=Talaromyces proteolyticus TaxID=1131652 RepID=A0AAD4KKN3_9EURO|nr:major facilitator superfamily transporter [Talaromyces proteolyticus]KAH8694998.1 major facilitator superfamily transporter [Talaromyces proteolyticus]
MSNSSTEAPDIHGQEADKDGTPPDLPAHNLHAFPEGGTDAWLTVAGASASLFVSFGWINSIGLFQEFFQDDLLPEYTPSEIAWIPSLMLLFMFIGGIFIGKVFDDDGPRYLLAFGTFLHVLGLMLTSVSSQYVQIILCQGVVSALGSSMIMFPAVSCVQTWFREKRGQAMGPVMGSSSLGGIIFPCMVTSLLPQVGFGWTYRICAFLILALCVFANFTIKSRLPPNPTKFQIINYLRPFKEPTFVFVSLGIFFFWWGMFIPMNFIVEAALQRGISVHLSRYLVAILNTTGVLGRAVPVALGDKLGHFNVTIIMAIFTTVLVLALLMPTTGQASILAFTALFGVGSGGVIGLAPVICAHVSPIREIGARIGTAYFFASFAALTGSPIGGQIVVDRKGKYFDTFLFAGVCCAIGTVSFIIARTTHAGFKLGKV